MCNDALIPGWALPRQWFLDNPWMVQRYDGVNEYNGRAIWYLQYFSYENGGPDHCQGYMHFRRRARAIRWMRKLQAAFPHNEYRVKRFTFPL